MLAATLRHVPVPAGSAVGLTLCLLVPGSPVAASPTQPATAAFQDDGPTAAVDAEAGLAPAEWARLVLEPCRDLAADRREADAALAARLASLPVPDEYATFLAREAEARASADRRTHQAALARLNAVLSGRHARFPDPDSDRQDTFQDVLAGLFARQDACAIEGVEATILFGAFDVTLDAEVAQYANPDREFTLIQAQVRRRLRRGESLERVYLTMRPASHDVLQSRVDAVIKAAASTEPLPSDDTAAASRMLDRRRRQFLEFLRYAAEPVRIRVYAHGQVDMVEGALGTTLPDTSEERLLQDIERALYPSVDHMDRLRAQPPSATVEALDRIVDRWFRATALPAVSRALVRDPFAAYAFFVQSGGVAADGPAFAGSRVRIVEPAFALTQLEDLRLHDALAYLAHRRVPADFVALHRQLEASFTELTLSPEDMRALIRELGVPPDTAATLGQLSADGAPGNVVSSLDVYRRLILDASRIRGRLDRSAVAAAMDVIAAAKAARLQQEIDRLLAVRPSSDPRLARYLRTDAALMLELEHRQALEPSFRTGTSGAVVGWLLGRFFIGGSVPIGLWAPGGVTGPEFGQLIDDIAPTNRASGHDYAGKRVGEIELVHDGREYHAALVRVIESAHRFINVSSFDWKTDTGGRDIAYRLMAKKLGIDGAAYARFLAAYERGLPMTPSSETIVPFYDLPTTRFKDLLVTHVILTSSRDEIARARIALREAGASLDCASVMTCGDLSALADSPLDDRSRAAYAQVEALFAEHPPLPDGVQRRRALRDYCEDAEALRRFVRRFGLRRSDRPDEPFEINVVADAKQNLFNLHVGEHSQQFPYVVTEPIRDIYFMLLEFDIRVLLWKGGMEFPWNLGPAPVPGRKMFGVVPMVFLPYPWLRLVPGFGWAGAGVSIFLQYLLATDVRIWWAMVNHTKSWSNESMALESGMGMGSKYFDVFEEHQTWHDMGVVVRGGTVDDVNDHFVQVFNEAHANNAGLPASRGAPVPTLHYDDYRAVAPPVGGAGPARSWLLTTHPEQGDSNYRGVFVAALAAARHNIYIENSFFSDPLIARLLMHKAREFRGRVSCAGLAPYDCAARKRDAVDIHLILPDSSDKPIVDAVGTADFHEMLHLGIKVYRWGPDAGWSATRMLHSKVWLIDYQPGRQGLAYVGAANITQRSHLADNEAGILSTDAGFARQVYERIFEPDMTTDSRLESDQSFHVVRTSSRVVRTSRWLRRVLVELFWFI